MEDLFGDSVLGAEHQRRMEELVSWVVETWAQSVERLVGMVELASWVVEGLARSTEHLVGMVEFASWVVESWA